MGKVTATCGHEIPNIGENYNVILKSWAHDNSRCISSEVACSNCIKEYQELDLLLYSEKNINKWLSYEP